MLIKDSQDRKNQYKWIILQVNTSIKMNIIKHIFRREYYHLISKAAVREAYHEIKVLYFLYKDNYLALAIADRFSYLNKSIT